MHDGVRVLTRKISEETQAGLVAVGLFKFRADAVELHNAPLELVEEEVDDRGGKEREGLGNKEAANNGNAQGLAEFGADTHADGEG